MQVAPDQQAFVQEMMEVEKEMNRANQQAQIAATEAFTLKRNIRKNELALADIEKSKDSKAIYLPLGKAFICRKPEYVKEEFTAINKKWTNDVQELEKNQKYYESIKKEK